MTINIIPWRLVPPFAIKPIRMIPAPKLPRPANQRPLVEATVAGAQSAAANVESVQLEKWYVTASPSGSTDLFQTNVIVVGTPVWPFVGETSTGMSGAWLPVADIPEPVRVKVTDVVPGTLLTGIANVPLAWVLAVGAKRTVRLQVADGDIDVPEQVSPVMLNGAAGEAIVPIARAAVPVLVTVTVASDV
jgi:hypothetical protein